MDVKKRRLCGPTEYAKGFCETGENCCYDDTDYGFHTVKCFAAHAREFARILPCVVLLFLNLGNRIVVLPGFRKVNLLEYQ